MVEVTQADRELLIELISFDSETIDAILAGNAFTWEVEQIARHRIAALEEARGDQVARVVEWLRDDADQTEIEAGHIVKNSSGNPRKNAAEWAMLVAMKRGLADAIERGEPFNGLA